MTFLSAFKKLVLFKLCLLLIFLVCQKDLVSLEKKQIEVGRFGVQENKRIRITHKRASLFVSRFGITDLVNKIISF